MMGEGKDSYAFPALLLGWEARSEDYASALCRCSM